MFDPVRLKLEFLGCLGDLARPLAHALVAMKDTFTPSPGHLGGTGRATALRPEVPPRQPQDDASGRDDRLLAPRPRARRAGRPPRQGLDKRGVLRQHYGTDALDASTLLAAIFGFLPGDDARLRATVLAIADELSENGFVLRYRTEETDDGLSGKEGTFVICSFWLVSALAIVGEIQRARDLMERLVKAASPLGLYAEEYDVDTGRHLGNFPQAFSHLALAEAAARIIVAEGLAEVAG
jgi:Glycosyl hydrolases family 15